ncbi:cation:dicarboxylate symporter family transporter [Pedobacter caeni]|uniref:Aerobic C4-dicarboxylate transport protein n=1 Tax=Pedobacter caeni TaxID=288992 RepID=A0A1M5NF21_9SPHI|nr:cation:dicarboxylase symporter family transporter [Pedobacter caeni]SHG88065.1 aerobic C4-dicarboxylate transport protein [Pedobacter caeni]
MYSRLTQIFSNLAFQVLIALILGLALGHYFPAFSIKQHFVSAYFIAAAEWFAAPVIFLTVASGIAGIASLKKLGRIILKSVVLFELVSTLAIVFGLVMAVWLKPGVINTDNLHEQVGKYAELNVNSLKEGGQAFSQSALIVLVLAILVGLLLHLLPARDRFIQGLDKVRDGVFRLITLFFRLTPLAVLSGMAYTVASFGLHSILPMGKLIAVMYLSVIIFVFGFLGLMLYLYRFNIWQLLVLIRDELLIVFGTSSSRSVIPLVIDKLDKFGCSKPVTGFVLSAGYSFNLIGTSIYLGMSIIFVAQLYHIHLVFSDYLEIILVLMLVSKGASGVPGAGFVALSSAVALLPQIPFEGLVFIFAVERFLNEARSITNTIGNAAATLVIARTENDFISPSGQP